MISFSSIDISAILVDILRDVGSLNVFYVVINPNYTQITLFLSIKVRLELKKK
ncbi:MAG: hypothetical protein SFY56_03445 [Bacteroidota bacterium]|nr:hypothetical protein [Bacteroidota bacterium]